MWQYLQLKFTLKAPISSNEIRIRLFRLEEGFHQIFLCCTLHCVHSLPDLHHQSQGFKEGRGVQVVGAHCAEGFKEGGGVVGVRTQRYMASYWPTDCNYPMRDWKGPALTEPPTPRPV